MTNPEAGLFAIALFATVNAQWHFGNNRAVWGSIMSALASIDLYLAISRLMS